MKNLLKKKWSGGEPTLGAWLTMPSSVAAEIMSRLGFDWLTIDLQHGLIGYSDAVRMLQAMSASDTVPLARVPWNEPGIIGKVLDAGAQGVVIPMVNTRTEAEAAVAACRYRPEGRRSFGPMRAALVHGSGYYDAANREICCMPMIETEEAVSNLDEILTVGGIDAVFVGPADLSVSLGLDPSKGPETERFAEAFDAILAGCARHGIVVGCAGTALTAPKRIGQGVLFVEVSRDSASMMRAAGKDLRGIRDLLAEKKE